MSGSEGGYSNTYKQSTRKIEGELRKAKFTHGGFIFFKSKTQGKTTKKKRKKGKKR